MTDNVPVDEPVEHPLDKPAWRALCAARRTRLSAEQIDRARRRVSAAVLNAADAGRWCRVAAYVPLRTEPASLELLAALADRHIELLVPTVLPDRDLDWAHWRGDGERLGPAAIATVDVVLVPALAVSLTGVRLGRGGGSYDRALARVADPVPRVALVYDDEFVAELPHDPWDRPVTAVARPSGWTDIEAPPGARVDGE